MKRIKLLSLVLVSASLLLFGCSDDDNGSGSAGDFDHLAVYAVNSGSGDLSIEMSGDTQVNFCYEGEGCESVSGSAFMSVFEGGRMELDTSDIDGVAVGVTVQFEVTGGEGYVEVVSGEAYMDDGWLEFDEGSVVYTSDAFSDGDTVTFSWGDTD